MNRYEHCIFPSMPRVIWVRRKGEDRWKIYMRCRSAEVASERLALLENPMGIEAVTDASEEVQA